MLDADRIKEAEKNTQQYIQDSLLFIKKTEMPQHVHFFMKNAETSILTAKTLYEISTNINKKQTLALADEFETYLWVIVSAYYTMFYAALALLAKNEIKTGDKIVHKVVADTLITKFLQNKKLAKLLENYEETKETALQITGTEQKAQTLIENFEHERHKRHKIQYEIGTTAKQNLAKTSLQRAEEFMAEIRRILKEHK
ncbi:hypothetical protein HY485_04320 [Candidatus Woesearchaeota archaeon]|nr:hypothetical protein [Candidatus Woesearchaeota archaeon]